jgi:FkbM family methyltransferase
MHKLVRLAKDFLGLTKICGPRVALRWLFFVHLHLLSIVRRGNLGLADRAMGVGPFEVYLRKYKCRFKIMGPQCVSGIREMYVRDMYLNNGWLEIRPHDTVLDLGANMGNFTNMALALQPTVNVIAVEPNRDGNRMFAESVGLNPGYLARTTLIRAILGETAEKIKRDEYCAGAESISEDQLLERAGAPHIDFIKCDIEGGEFRLLTRQSKLLRMARALACEVHAGAGNMNVFIAEIEAAGFIIGPTQHAAGGGSATFVAKRERAPQATDGLLLRAETSSS